MRAVIYARYSAGPRQTEQSIEGQVRACRDFAEQKVFTVTEVYADEHITGRSADRAEFQRLIADAKQGKFDAVIVYQMARLSRNKYDLVIYKRELHKCGVQIFYAAEPIPDGPEGIILEGLLESMAEYYSAELSRKVQRGMKETALKGLSNGGAIPFGYRIEDKKYVIDERDAEGVRMLFDRYVKGEPVAAIVRDLNAWGYPISKHGVYTMLENRKYIGEYRWKEIVIPDAIPAIIDPALFALAQKERQKRKVRRVVKMPGADYLLSGKLFCGECGSMMQGVSGTGKNGNTWYYYSCPQHRKKKCDLKNVPKDWLEDMVTDLAVRHVLNKDMMRVISHKVAELLKDDRSDEKEYLQKRLQDNTKSIGNIVAAIETGSKALAARLLELENEKEYLETELKRLSSPKLTEDHVYFMLEKLLEKGDPKEIIRTFVSEVWLYNGSIEIYFNLTEKRTSKKVFEQSEACSTISIHSRTLLRIVPSTVALSRVFG